MRAMLRKHGPILSGVAHLGGARILTSGLSFLAGVMVARGLSVEDFGVYSLIAGVFAYAAILSEFGMRSTAVSEAARLSHAGTVARTYMTLRFMIALGCFAVTTAAAWVWYPEYRLVAMLVMGGILLLPFQADWILLAAKRYAAAAWLGAARPILWVGMLGVAVLVWGLTLERLAALFLLSWGIAVLLSWVQVARSGIAVRRAAESEHLPWKKLFSMSWPVLGMTLILQALTTADLIWIGSTLGSEQAGLYSLAFSIITAGLLFANALCQTALARYPAYREDSKGFAVLLQKEMHLITAVAAGLALVLYLIVPPFIPAIFGEKYRAAIPLLIDFLPYAKVFSCMIL